MIYLFVPLLLILAYLSGSVNYAIIVTRLVTGRDIRTMGNKNPGTANVGRSVGKGWAGLVFFLDVAKGLGPMILSRSLFFPGDNYWDFFIVAAVGIAAITGHCKPLFFQFRGGGGIATSIGVYAFFIPAELLLCLIVAFVIALLFIRGVRFRVGQGVPILFVSITPFATLVLNFFVDLPLFAGRSLGGHPWYILVIAFVLSFFIIGMNSSFVGRLLKGADSSGEENAEKA
ncbi:MAG: glycerol-3-phosphate acyltransferase [Spirochaetaceae bacterium]|nr:MAG: glycerol-3-phosphate acyltransferase [Spirochaetaceae bacterium]